MDYLKRSRGEKLAGVLAIVAAFLYRMGGIGLPFNTKVRDLGVPSVMIVYFILSNAWNWWLLLCFPLMFGAQTSYFKKKGVDAKWWNWLLVGIAFSVCMLPYSIAIGNLVGFNIRFALVTIFTTLWSENISIDWLEEGGRGFIQIITLPLLVA